MASFLAKFKKKRSLKSPVVTFCNLLGTIQTANKYHKFINIHLNILIINNHSITTFNFFFLHLVMESKNYYDQKYDDCFEKTVIICL